MTTTIITNTITETETIKRRCNQLEWWAHNCQAELDLPAILLLGNAVTLAWTDSSWHTNSRHHDSRGHYR